jgi:hypothetical protein
MIHRGRVGSVVIACGVIACASLAACGDAPPETQGTGASTGSSQTKRNAGAVPPEMVAAVSSGMGSRSVSVHFELEATPAVGMALPVEIALVPQQKYSLLRAVFSAPEGVQMSQGQQFNPRSDVMPGQVFTHRLVLQPTREGIYLISVGVETEGDDGNITRSYSIPLIVDGGGAAQPAAEQPGAAAAPSAGAPEPTPPASPPAG